ncbi:MAG: hypothetical protein FJ207_14905, partial [Gemmatimonadetes bacterium]|nr:hypothetical protein [Gemmatimonadota bacterium]
MSHVDEGALHAYLDGALDEYPAAEARRIREHVETCAMCMERLAEERKVREDANAILGLAAPQVEVPTFEELRAYVVRTTKAERSTMSVRLYRMSWAASVVLALGTGWMLRGGEAVPIAPLERAGGADVAATAQEAAAAPAADDALQLEESERAASALEAQTTGPSEPAPAAAGRVADTGARAEVA